jgi:transglutaminase-like putative cysteine protease
LICPNKSLPRRMLYSCWERHTRQRYNIRNGFKNCLHKLGIKRKVWMNSEPRHRKGQRMPVLRALPSITMSIPEGEAGTRETLKLMRSLVRLYKSNPYIRDFAGNLVKGLPGKAWFSEIRAIFSYVQTNIRYTQDINGVETLQTPTATLGLGYGDCDDMCTLLCSLLEAVGHPTAFIAVGFEPGEYEHVYVLTMAGDDPNRQWISLDPTEPNPMGWYPPDTVSFMKVEN